MMATVLFLLGAAFVLYVLFGYPLLLAIRARLFAKPVQKRPQEKTVSIILPVRNGEPWIRAKLRSILDLQYPRELLQILVVSDGSTDATENIVNELQAEGVELIRLAAGGKAAALNAGMERATGEILFFTDVRQPLDPSSLRDLVSCFADPEVGAVSGKLIIADSENREQDLSGIYWRYEKWIRRRLSRIDSVTGSTGCIHAIRRSLARPLPPDILLDDVYVPLSAFFSGYRVVWESKAKAFDVPASLRIEFRRKLRTQAGLYQLLGVYPQLLSRRNRMWFDFASHKLARLLLPYALLVIAVTSLGLPGQWASLAVATQVIFYGLAVADLVIPATSRLKRISSPARAFVVMMAAVLCAASILFVPATSFWKQGEKR